MAPVFLFSEIPNGVRRWVALTVIALLAVVIAVGCGKSEPIESAAQVTDENMTQETTGGAEVIATTSGGPAERKATTGIASTTAQDEASASGTSASGTSKALAEIPTQPASESASDSESAASEEAPFVASPEANGGAGYGADGILGVRYGIHEGYERVVVDLGTGEEPARSVPEWTLSSPAGDGTLRVTFPSISMTDVSDGTFSGPLLKDFYVVHAPEGGMFVDIFSESAFTYRVIELSNPARLVVDFKPSDASLELPPPAEAANTVLTQPRSGARVGGALMVSGYSRNPEAANTIILTAGGDTLLQDTVMSNDWTMTWGYFETTLNVPNFSGEGKLKVGARSARDGTFEGVKIPVHGTG